MFKLRRYFSITSFIAFIIVAIFAGALYRQLVLVNLLEIAENKNVALTQAFSNSLWLQFEPFVASAAEFSTEELQNQPQIAELRQAVLMQMQDLSVVKVKVYDLNGLTVFSTEAGQIGQDKSDNAGFLAARSGQVASELTHRDTFSAFEGVIEDRNVFSSYIPIRRGGPDAPIEGVFEIYDDVTPLLQRLAQAQRNVVIGVAIILSILYLVLYFIVRHADRIIQHQYNDITAKQNALRESEKRLQQVFTSISDHIYVTEFGPDGQRVNRYLSPTEALTGYPLEKLLADWNFWPSKIIHPDDRAKAAAQAERLAQGNDSELEYRLIRADGQVIWVRDSGTVEKDAETGNFIVYGVVSNITERKQAEKALAQARDEALAASRLKTRLLANVSHDIRTPLNAILGYTDMLQEGVYGSLSQRQRSATSEIIDSTGQLLNFVNNLLDQAQIDSGQVVLKTRPFSPAELLEAVVSTIGVLVKTKNLNLATTIAGDIPPTLSGDFYWLRQILVNLVSNAIKFTDKGSIYIQIYKADNDHWAIEVADTGRGIAAQDQSYIFEAFRQIDNNVSRNHSGSGLGLSIVHQLTTMMGGQISVTSELGCGSAFTISLPFHPLGEKTV
jgi:PAS domain S-box-containing protein